MPSLFPDITLEVLNEYVVRNIMVDMRLDMPSLEERQRICHATGLMDYQLQQWLLGVERKCSPDVVKQLILHHIGITARGMVAQRSAVPKSKVVNRGRPISNNIQRQDPFLCSKAGIFGKVNQKSVVKREPVRVSLDEVQLATLEQCWHKGVIQNPINHVVISTITDITTASVKEWGENRTRLGEGYLFDPKPRHFEALRRRLDSKGLMYHEGVRQLVPYLEKDVFETVEKARATVFDNARRSGLLFQPSIHADIAILTDLNVSDVQRLADEYRAMRTDFIKEESDEKNPAEFKAGVIIKNAQPTQSGIRRQPDHQNNTTGSVMKKEKTPDTDADPEWTPQNDSCKPGKINKRSRSVGAVGTSSKKKKFGFSADTYLLLNHAWNTKLILKPELHYIVSTLANISVKQLKTWINNKRHRSPNYCKPVVMGTSGSRTFSSNQEAMLNRAFEKELLTGTESAAVVAELAQLTTQQVLTWLSNKKICVRNIRGVFGAEIGCTS